MLSLNCHTEASPPTQEAPFPGWKSFSLLLVRSEQYFLSAPSVPPEAREIWACISQGSPENRIGHIYKYIEIYFQECAHAIVEAWQAQNLKGEASRLETQETVTVRM